MIIRVLFIPLQVYSPHTVIGWWNKSTITGTFVLQLKNELIPQHLCTGGYLC